MSSEPFTTGMHPLGLQTEKQVSILDGFFDLGGDSIRDIEEFSDLQERVFTFPMWHLFTEPSPKQPTLPLVPADREAQPEGSFVYPLSDAQRAALERSIGSEGAECVYPVTRQMRKRLEAKDPWMMYPLFVLSEGLLTEEQFLLRMKELTKKHAVLRSVFICPEGEEPLQAVRKHYEPKCFFVDLRGLSQGHGLSAKQKSYFRTLLRMETERPKDIEREVLFQAGLIRISETERVLFLPHSHLLLDGTSLARVVRELVEPVETESDTDVWNRRMHRLYRERTLDSAQYWETLLHHCKGAAQLPCNRKAADNVPLKSCFAAGEKKLYEGILTYCREHQLTPAALVHFAVGSCLMDLSGQEDVCFYSIVSGRTEDDADLVGMLSIPFPVRLRRTDFPGDCQAQLLSSMVHVDVLAISDAVEKLLGTKEPVALDIQSFFADYGNGCRQMDLLEIADSPEQMKAMMQIDVQNFDHCQLGLRVRMVDGFSCAGLYHAELYDNDIMKRFPAELIRKLRVLIASGGEA